MRLAATLHIKGPAHHHTLGSRVFVGVPAAAYPAVCDISADFEVRYIVSSARE